MKALKSFLSNYEVIDPDRKVKCVKAGATVPKKRSKKAGLLHLAGDWKLMTDLAEQKLVVPSCLAVTTLGPCSVV